MLLATADLWDDLDADAPETWVDTGIDQVARALTHMYPAATAKMREQQFEAFHKYRDFPDAYIREILRIEPSPKQVEIAQALMRDPYKVIVVSCNNYGKSHLAGGLVNWWYDAYDPGLCITTAPRLQDVVEVLWKEVKMQRRTRSDFRGEMAPKLFDHQGHYAEGYTGNNVTAFHGRHDEFMFFILDEATAIKSFVWQGIKSMFKKTGKHHFLALLNPTDTTSPAYAEAQSGNYTVIRLSALEHPNILAELKGESPRIPGAVDSSQLLEWFNDPLMFEEVHPEDFMTGDVLWPPPWADQHGALKRFGRDGKRICYRPGPEGQARVLGLWPTSSPGAVWSDLAWQAACRELDGWKPLPVRWRMIPQIGCDVATGTAERGDKVSIVVQIEGVAVAHRTSSGWDINRTIHELVNLAVEWAKVYNSRRDPRQTRLLKPEGIPIKVDDGGVGAGVTSVLKAKGFNVFGVNAGTSARSPDKYPRLRDELWFGVPLAAARGEIDLSRLSTRTRNELRRQAMGVQWKPDFSGRRQVERKDETKKRIGRSPDDIDALNLAYLHCPTADTGMPEVFDSFQGPIPTPPPADSPRVIG